MDTKARVRDLLDRLPENCTLEDVLYHLYVLREIEAGREEVREGRTLSHDEVAREMRRKWLLGAAG